MSDPLLQPPSSNCDDEGGESASNAAPLFQHDIFVEQLDRTIARFGDDPSGHPPPKPTTAEESLIRTYAPTSLEAPFQELYSILYPCLRPRKSPTEDATTASAILMGPRGSGKSLLVERCLAACQHSQADDKETNGGARFRKVVVNGIVVRGEDVPSVVYEIIRQLSDMAMREDAPLNDDNVGLDGDESTPKRRRRGLKEDDEYLLRLRKSTFTSNLTLLENTLKMAEIDRIPILLVLDELDAFILNSKGTGGDTQQHRQLLLYHLLDRVATPGSNLTLIGLTSNFTALTQMEKRIRSRAEGTSKIVYVRPPVSYDQLLQILVHDKLQGCPVQDQISALLSPSTATQPNENQPPQPENEDRERIAQTMQREFRMGRDMRWFCRVLYSALSLYRFDCVLSGKSSSKPPSFSPDYFVSALAMMGSLCLSDTPTASATKQSSLCLVDGVAVDPRLQASLLDLSQPQVALLLSARRILTREAHLEQALMTNNDNTVGVAPLTLQRMIREYQSFRRGIKTNEELLTTAAKQLLERGVLCPSLDHSGGGPLQYHASLSYQTLDPYSLSRLPLHLPVAMERELEHALQRNLMDCSTALKEWGRKTN
jgi:Cdc6-like AAA superfamily ATPase